MSKRKRTRNGTPAKQRPAVIHRARKSAEHPIAVALIGATALMATAIPAVIISARPTVQPPQQSADPSPSPAAIAPLIHGDSTAYIKDLNYPDMSAVGTDESFVKQWEIKNTGSVRWTDRYMIPDGTATGTCAYPGRVPVPDTDPGQPVVISVPVTAASNPQLCLVTWKMATATGVLYFPGYVGIWFEVRVVGNGHR